MKKFDLMLPATMVLATINRKYPDVRDAAISSLTLRCAVWKSVCQSRSDNSATITLSL